VRTIDWVDGAVEIIDQTALPARTVTRRLSTVDELVAAIRTLAVRGAPALGVAGALGVALAARQYRDQALAEAVLRLETARPTAVNLARGVQRAVSSGPPRGWPTVRTRYSPRRSPCATRRSRRRRRWPPAAQTW
jgi:methylthioribose-1-phosphate isomerase